MLANEDLRHGCTPVRALDHLFPNLAAVIHRNFAVLDSLRLQQRLRAPAIGTECLGIDFDRHDAPSFEPLFRQAHQRINWEGVTKRAQVTSSTRSAPARLRARAHASAVLPVVRTSSMRTMVLPLTAAMSATANAPDTVFRRCRALMSLRAGVRRVRRGSMGSAEIFS